MSVKEPIYYINGEYVQKSKAFISVLDLGLVRGFGLFDFLITYGGKPFLIKDHIRRLLKSCKIVGIEHNFKASEIENNVIQTLEKNNDGKEKTVKIILTGGPSEDGMFQSGKPTLAIIVMESEGYPEKFYSEGIKVITANYIRQLPNIKNLDYKFAIKALKEAKHAKASEVIYTNKKGKEIYEGTRSNLFIVKNKIIYTPKNGVLSGLARELVIKLAKGVAKVVETKIKESNLLKADEVFITSTSKQVMPVTKVNSKTIGNGKPGEITKKLMKKYNDFVKSGNW